ncbi:MAG TPA: hypothetical protein VGQ57_01215 [Polyangiaceae bacterium]|nr:hypothetical protein [Polyangiaceae bacterium]
MAGAVLALAGVIACIVGYGYLALDQISGIQHDLRVWNAGGADLPATYEGTVTERQFVLKTYQLKVEFLSPNGAPQSKPLEVTTLFGGLEDAGKITVRLMPGSVDDFALNVAVGATSTRWAAVAFLVIVGIALLGGTCLFLVFSIAKQCRRVLRAARAGAPVAAELLSREHLLHQGKPTGTEVFKFKLPPSAAGGSPMDVKYQCRTKGSDVIVLAAGKAVLAVVPQNVPSNAILLLRDYYPLRLSDAQRLQADAAVAGAQG